MSLIEGDIDKFDKIYQNIKKFGPLLAIVSYVAGIVYFCMLPHEMLHHRTYVSENALLPGKKIKGLVSSNIYSMELLNQYHDLLKNHYESQSDNKIDLDFVKNLFVKNANIEAYVQHFNISSPFQASGKGVKKGRNVYAFGRAQRADNTESIVITAPLYVLDSSYVPTPNLVGVSQLFVMADLTKNHPYWAKDLVFVVHDEGHFGAQAWINSYYDIKSDYIFGENLKKRGGSIQAALNLEFIDMNIDKLELKIEGPNGKLPNLDLFNTIIRICRTMQFTCSLESEKGSKEYSYYQDRPPMDHKEGLENAVLMVLKQATGVPTSSHGFFLNHRIEALTISGYKNPKQNKRQNYKQNLLKVTRIIESTLRSINNLLERFHQSFFFYLLPSSNYYISIGMYMPAFGLVALPILIQIITIWCSLFFKKKTINFNKIENTSSILLYLFRLVIPNLLVSFIFGLLLHFGTTRFIYYGKRFQMNPSDALFNFYVAVTINILCTPILINFKKLLRQEKNIELKEYIQETSEQLSKLIILLGLIIILGTLSVLNFSLSFLIAIFYVPVAYLTTQSITNKLFRLIQILLSLLATPIIYFAFVYAGYVWYFKNVDLTKNHYKFFKTVTGHFYDLALLSKLSNIWTYDLINLCLIPIWASIWFIVFPRF